MFVLKLRKVQTKDTSIFALKMEKSGLRTAAKPLGDPILQENALFLLKKHEIAAFVLVDKSGYFYGGEGGIRTIERLLTVTRFPIVRILISPQSSTVSCTAVFSLLTLIYRQNDASVFAKWHT